MNEFISQYGGSSLQIFGLLGGPITDPVGVFLIIMAIMLVAPLMFERIRLPGIVGLILAGVLVGPNGLGVLQRDSTIVLLGTVGLLFLMFLAGLETSLDDLKQNANQAMGFGFATFAIPMLMGTLAFLGLGYNILASLLVASCFASHTLLSLPIASKLGIMRSNAILTTLGGTLITNVLALLVLAVIVKAHQGNLTLNFWLFLIPSLTLYTVATLWGVPRVGRWFFRRFGHDEGAEFLFVVATLFVVSYAAKLIEIEAIIGAFLAGIAITQLIPQLSPLMNRIQFIGNTLFVPFFLISVGMLVDLSILTQEWEALLVAIVMIVVAIVAKLIPAWITGQWFHYPQSETLTIFGLSVAQAASTLAAITVAYNIQLVDQRTVNGTIAMILVTCLLSPWVTERWGRRVQRTTSQGSKTETPLATPNQPLKYRILVPVANPNTEDNLLQLGILLAKQSQGTLLPFHVLLDHLGPISEADQVRQTQLLASAEQIAHGAVTKVRTIGRVDDSVDQAIVRATQENQASLVICGWKGYSNYRDNFFGSVIDNVLRRSPVPVLVTRFTNPLSTTRRVLLAIADAGQIHPHLTAALLITHTLATELKANLELVQITVQHLRIPSVLEVPPHLTHVTLRQAQGPFIPTLLDLLSQDDLLVLIVDSQPTLPGLSALGTVPEAIARQNPRVSILIIHYPPDGRSQESGIDP